MQQLGATSTRCFHLFPQQPDFPPAPLLPEGQQRSGHLFLGPSGTIERWGGRARAWVGWRSLRSLLPLLSLWLWLWLWLWLLSVCFVCY